MGGDAWCPAQEPLWGWAATPPPPVPGTSAGFCTCHLTPWVRGGPGLCFKHQGGGGWECGGRATPGTYPSHGASCRLHKCAASAGGSGSRPRPLPGPAARAYPRPGDGGVGAGRGSCRRILAPNILDFGRTGVRPAGWPHYAPGGPRSALRLHGPRPQLCAGREPAPPAPSPRGAGRGCGAGGTSDSALRARRLHGAQCQRAEPAALTVRRGLPSRRGDAARA